MDDLNLTQNIDELIALSVIVVGLVAAYGKAFAGYQTILSQWVIDAFAVESRFRGLVNLAVGLLIGTGFSLIAAQMLGTWTLVPVGIFAGFLSSVEASKKHDEGQVPQPDDEPPKEADEDEPGTAARPMTHRFGPTERPY